MILNIYCAYVELTLFSLFYYVIWLSDVLPIQVQHSHMLGSP